MLKALIHLFKVQYCVGLLRLNIFHSLGQKLPDVEVGLDVAVVLPNHGLEVRESLLELPIVIGGQAALLVALKVDLAVVGL